MAITSTPQTPAGAGGRPGAASSSTNPFATPQSSTGGRTHLPERSYSSQTLRGSYAGNSNGNGNGSQSGSDTESDTPGQQQRRGMYSLSSALGGGAGQGGPPAGAAQPTRKAVENYVHPYGDGSAGKDGGGSGGGEAGAQTNGNGNLSWGAPFPALHLWPLNETFVMKMIHLPPGQRVKIGRQTNAKTVPGERNGYFDSKVLSRQHAEVWEENGKIYLQDVKSSNGTFINGERLSAEGAESEPCELKSEDTVEFGIDIVSEDNKTVVHRKVASKAYCVFSVDDAGMSARELTQYYPHDPRQSMGPIRRPQAGAQGHTGPGGQGNGANGYGPSVMSAGGKAQGLNFDHVLHKLQTELQKSRETGQDLMSLTNAMTDIQDTLGGGMPPSQNGSADEYIPPQFRGPSGVPDKAMGDTSATIAALQAQLNSTQSILVSHKDRIKSLEHLLNEHEAIKDEVLEMRRSMEESKREIEELLLKEERAGRASGASSDDEAETNDHGEDGDGEPGANGNAKDGLGVEEEDIADGGHAAAASTTVSKAREEEIIEQNNALAARLDALTAELEEALQLSRSLQNQHAESTSTVKILETRIQALEKDVATRVVDASGKAGRAAEDRWEAWRTKFEESWKKERESWDLERERLKGVVREWEEASRRSQEEEEERLMNERRKALEDGDSDSDEEDDDSPWLNGDMSTSSDPGPEFGPALVPGGGSPLARSSSASPRSAAKGLRKSRRESNSRLDPAIRALRAASGGDRFGEGSSNGRTTPRNASPSTAADDAMDALRLRSARVRRAGTITRKRTAPQSIDPAEGADSSASRRSSDSPGRLGKTSSSVTVKGLSGLTAVTELHKDDLADGPGSGNSETHSTSTESDETAHEDKRAHAGALDKAVNVADMRRGEGPPIKLGVVGQHPIPLAISIAVLGVAAYAVLNRAKD